MKAQLKANANNIMGKTASFAQTSLYQGLHLLLICGSLILTLPRYAQGQCGTVSGDTNYATYGLNPDTVEKWEDGLRTNPNDREFEWWYFDARIDSGDHAGTTIVIGFYTKSFLQVSKNEKPFVTVNINPPKGKGQPYQRVIKLGSSESFAASKDSCHVSMGSSYFIGNLNSYQIHVVDTSKKLEVDVTLTRNAPSWRPQTGYSIFRKGNGKENYFAWVVAVPNGTADVKASYKDPSTEKIVTVEGKGHGYHDHNWGDRSIAKLFNHWYWSHASIGDYTVIASSMIAAKQYNFGEQVVFNVSTDKKRETNDGVKTLAYQSYARIDQDIGKDISDDLLYVYTDSNRKESGGSGEEVRYEFSLEAKNTLTKVSFLAAMLSRNPSKPRKGLGYYIARRLSGFDGAYVRFTGKVGLRVIRNNQVEADLSSIGAVWELMYLGKPLK